VDADKVFTLAALVGLTQAGIAQHFGVARAQAHRWAHGERPIPRHYHADLVRLLYTATAKALGPDSLWYLWRAAGVMYPSTPAPTRRLAEIGQHWDRERDREQLAALFFEIFLGHMAEIGEGPADVLADLLQQAGAYGAMGQEVLHKPDHLVRLAELGRRITANAEVQLRFGDLLPLLAQTPGLSLAEEDVCPPSPADL